MSECICIPTDANLVEATQVVSQFSGEVESKRRFPFGNRFFASNLDHLDARIGDDRAAKLAALEFDSRSRDAEVDGVKAYFPARTIEFEVDADRTPIRPPLIRIDFDVELDP